MIKQCILSLLCLLWAGQTVLAGELRERVYLQTDKQFYLSGELVWMKFIATDLDQRLSDVSKVGYVELLDSASAVVQARLVLEKGVGNGCLQLPSTLPTGNYRLVAYTRYMRNEGEEVFFEKPLTVVNTQGFNLPQTGSRGIWMYSVFGVIAMGAAAFMIFRLMRKQKSMD